MPGEFIEGPDFVILGVPFGAGVRVVASRTLSLAELKGALNLGPGGFSDAFELCVTMDDIATADGPDYGAAIRDLFASWSPDPARPVELVARPALPAPRPAVAREVGVGWAKEPRSS